MRTTSVRTLAGIALYLTVSKASLLAQTFTWTGAGGNALWNNANNWSGTQASGATLYFGAAEGYEVNRNIASATAPIPFQLIFSEGAESYTFTGNRVRLSSSGLLIRNESGVTQTFSQGLEFGSFGGKFEAFNGDIVVEGGVTGGSNRMPTKDGIGTVTISGVSNVQLGVSIAAGTLRLDEHAQTFGGVNNVVFNHHNTSSLEISGAKSGVTAIEKTVLTLNNGGGAAGQIRLYANGGDGVHLNFTNEAAVAVAWFGGTDNGGASFNIDLSSSPGNRLSLGVLNNNASLSASGVWQWLTVTDQHGTGFGTLSSGTNVIRNETFVEFNGAEASVSSSNYRLSGATTLTANRSVGSITLQGESGGSISERALTTGAMLMQEGAGDFVISGTLLPLTSNRLFIHQYSMDGDLILDGAVHRGTANGFFSKAGPGTVIIGENGRVLNESATNVQGGRLEVNGEIERSAQVRVFHTATLDGAGKIGTQMASAVEIFSGGTLKGTTSKALEITGSLAFEDYADFRFTLDYTGSDYVDVVGSITLADKVNLALDLSKAPELGELVTILQGTEFVGEFYTVNGQKIGEDGRFTLDYDFVTYGFQISYEDHAAGVIAYAVVPEASSQWMTGMALGIVWVARRMRKSAPA